MSAGRQLVDGVAGARPGSRPGGRPAEGRAGGRPGLEGLGRWVEDRLDWLLEGDDDWREPWEPPTPRRSALARRDQRDPHDWSEAAPVPPPVAAGRPAAVARPAAPSSPAPRRPLEAISRRATPLLAPRRAPQMAPVDPPPPPQSDPLGEEWPDDASFSVPRWQRDPRRQGPAASSPQEPATPPVTPGAGPVPVRPLPRSTRRRQA